MLSCRTLCLVCFFFSSRRRHTRLVSDWSSDVCSSDLDPLQAKLARDRLRSEEFVLESDRIAALAAVNALRNRAPGDSVPVTSIDLAALREIGRASCRKECRCRWAP